MYLPLTSGWRSQIHSLGIVLSLQDHVDQLHHSVPIETIVTNIIPSLS